MPFVLIHKCGTEPAGNVVVSMTTTIIGQSDRFIPTQKGENYNFACDGSFAVQIMTEPADKSSFCRIMLPFGGCSTFLSWQKHDTHIYRMLYYNKLHRATELHFY